MSVALPSSTSFFSPGIRLMLMATFCLACMHAVIKSLSNLHVFELIFFRSIITALFCVHYLKSRSISFRGSNQKYLFLRSLFGVLTMLMFFITLQRIPLGASVSLKYLTPIFTAFFAGLYLKERIKPAQWVCFFVAFVGVLILKGFDARIDTLNLIFGVAGAVFGGLVYVMIRKIGKSEHPMVIINYFMLFTAGLSGVAMIPFWRTPQGMEWLLLLAAGTIGYFGQVYLTRAVQMEEASRVAPVQYTEVIFSLMLGLVWFGEGYSFLSLIGITFILAGAVLSLLTRHKKLVPA